MASKEHLHLSLQAPALMWQLTRRGPLEGSSSPRVHLAPPSGRRAFGGASNLVVVLVDRQRVPIDVSVHDLAYPSKVDEEALSCRAGRQHAIRGLIRAHQGSSGTFLSGMSAACK